MVGAGTKAIVGRAFGGDSVPYWIGTLATTLVVAFWTALFVEIEHLRDHYIASAEREATSMVRAFAEHSQRTLKSSEGVTRQIAHALDRGQDPELPTILERNPDLRGVGGYIAIVDANGDVIESSLGSRDLRVNVSDRDWFETIRASPPGSFSIDKPLLSRVSDRWSIPLVLRRENRDGEFIGAIFFSVLTAYFDEFYSKINLGRQGAITVAGLDGTIYARRANSEMVMGRAYPSLDAVLRARVHPVGAFHGSSPIDGVTRLTVYRLLNGYPLVVFIGLSEEDFLHTFFEQRRIMLAQGTALTLLGLLLAGIATRLLRRERHARAEMARSEQRLRDAVDSLDAGFALFDKEDRLVLWNERWLDQVSYLRQLPMLKGMRYEEIVRAGFAKTWIDDSRALNDPEAWIARRVFEHLNPPPSPIELKVGDGRWIQINERRTAEGGIVGIRTDITTLKQQEQALRENEERLERYVNELEQSRGRLEAQAADLARLAEQTHLARERAEEANIAKSRFLANMSHELRTPLNAIIGFSDMMKNQLLGPVGSPRYIEYATDIHTSGEHLLSLINDVLDMSKIEAGKYEIRPEPLDGVAVMKGCARLVNVRASEANVALRVDAPEALPVKADERALKQILLNLLSNAIKFTPANGSVRLTGGRESGGVVFHVADTGIGISQEHIARLCQRFEQVDNSWTRKGEGTGLGLALSRALTELHGGRLAIESEEGRGTTVTVWLPDIPASAPATERAA